MTPDQKIEWAISSGGLDDVAVYHETCELIRKAYPNANLEIRVRLIQAIRDAVDMRRREGDDEAIGDGELYDWFDVLHRADRSCELAIGAFRGVQDKYPDWEPREHPDLLHHVSAARRIVPVSPWEPSMLESRPAAEWIDEVIGYEPSLSDRFNGKDAAYAVANVAKKDIDWGLDFARGLAARDEWTSDIWAKLIPAWRGVDFDEKQFSAVLDVIGVPQLFGHRGRDIADLLYLLVENGGKPYAATLLPNAKKIARLMWDASENEMPQILSETDWLTHALNSAAGNVVRFWLSALWVPGDKDKFQDGHLLDEDREMFDLVVSDDRRRGNLGQAMLATQLGSLLSVDADWVRNQFLPLFEPDHDCFVPAWHGFTWGQLTANVGKLMAPRFLKAVNHIEELKHVGIPSRRDAFVRQYAAMTVYVVDEPLSEWITALFRNSDARDRFTFAWEIGQILENMEDVRKIEIWERWLNPYWENRLVGKPTPVSGDEIVEMLRWPKDLNPVFDEAVDMAVQLPVVKLQHINVTQHIVDTETATAYPEGSAKFLKFLDTMETDFWVWDGIESLTDALLETDLDAVLKADIKNIRAKRSLQVPA